MSKIRIGTASWSDPGFVEDWYPTKLPASRRLRWYAEHFNYVEVNATFYAIPTAKTVERWVLETPDDFLFDVKLPKILSRHAMKPQFFPPDLRARLRVANGKVELTPKTEKLVTQRLLTELAPLIESKKLGAFLLQLTPAFSPKNHQLTELDSIRDLLAPHSLAVELRNRDWVVADQLSETLDYFTSRKLTFVLVDAPPSEHFTVMPGLDCVTNQKLGYFRAHGRNAEGYVKGKTVAERFDHEYTLNEVKQIAERLREVSQKVDELHVAANNNRSNYAPKLAKALQEQLGIQRELQQKLEYIKKPKQGQLI